MKKLMLFVLLTLPFAASAQTKKPITKPEIPAHLIKMKLYPQYHPLMKIGNEYYVLYYNSGLTRFVVCECKDKRAVVTYDGKCFRSLGNKNTMWAF